MKYVLDASVGLKASLPEPDSAKAVALSDDYARGAHQLIAPETLPIEIAHGLSRAGRRGVILHSEVSDKLFDILANAPLLYPYIPLLARAVEISVQERIGVYDCLYVALAEREQCELVTADNRLLNALQNQFPIVSLASLA